MKDRDELDAIRSAIAIADKGQAAARSAFAPGVSELELWTSVRAAMETAASGRLPVLADLVTGPRTADVGGAPGKRRADRDDLLLIDLVPRVGPTGPTPVQRSLTETCPTSFAMLMRQRSPLLRR